MKKLISLGLVGAMIASLAPHSFAAGTYEKGTAKDINTVYVLKNDETSVSSAQKLIIQDSLAINGSTFRDVVSISGKMSDTGKIVFGGSDNIIFGVASTTGVAQKIVPAYNSSNGLTKSNEGTFSNKGCTLTKLSSTTITGAGAGEYKKACGLKYEFIKKPTSDQYDSFTITLKDKDGNTKDITIVTTCLTWDKEDTSDAEGDVEDEGYIKFAGDTKLQANYPISAQTLAVMAKNGKNYMFSGLKGVDVLASVSKKSTGAAASYRADLVADSALEERYAASDSGNAVKKLYIPFLVNETRTVNIDCENDDVISILGSDITDKVVAGSLKKLFVYPVDGDGYAVLSAKASGSDGVVDTEQLITATTTDGKIAFKIPQGVDTVMISLKEIDTDELEAIEGLEGSSSSSEDSDENEVVAPIMDEDLYSDSEESSEVLDLDVEVPSSLLDSDSSFLLDETPSLLESDSDLLITPSVIANEEESEALDETLAPTPIVAGTSPVLTTTPATTNSPAQSTGSNDVVALAITLSMIAMAGAGLVASKKF